MLCTAKTTLKWGYLLQIQRRGRKIINHHIVEGTRESHPRVHDLQHPRLGKPRRGLQIMDTRMGFPCPFHSVVIDSINLYVPDGMIIGGIAQIGKTKRITNLYSDLMSFILSNLVNVSPFILSNSHTFINMLHEFDYSTLI